MARAPKRLLDPDEEKRRDRYYVRGGLWIVGGGIVTYLGGANENPEAALAGLVGIAIGVVCIAIARNIRTEYHRS